MPWIEPLPSSYTLKLFLNFQGWIPERRDELVSEFAEAGQTDLDTVEDTIRWDLFKAD